MSVEIIEIDDVEVEVIEVGIPGPQGPPGTLIEVAEDGVVVASPLRRFSFLDGFDVVATAPRDVDISLDLSEITVGGELSGPLETPTVDALHSGTTHQSIIDTEHAHEIDVVGAHDASAIAFTPSGTISSADAQSAIVEALTDAKTYTDDGHVILSSRRGATDGVAELDSSGKVPSSELPAFSFGDVFTVASQAEMLALAAQPGDVAIRTDVSETFILGALPASDLANWHQLLSPAGGVTSVNTRTGAVTGVQDTSEKGAVSGYAALDGSGYVPDAQLNPAIARDTEVADAVTVHTGDATDAHDASAVSLLDTANQYTATDVEAALAEVLDAEQAHEADASAAHAASAVAFTPTGTISATDVQAAIAELGTEDAATHIADSSAAHAASAVAFTPTGSVAATDAQAAIAEVASEYVAADAVHLAADAGTAGKLHIRISEPPPIIHQSATGDDAFAGWRDRPKLTVQAAMDTVPIGGIVQLGDGTFSHAVSLLPPALLLSGGPTGSVTIRGRGAGTTILRMTAPDYIFKVGNPDGVTRSGRVYIEDMTLLGAHASCPGGLQINGMSYGAVRRCGIKNFPVANGAGITNVPGTHCYFWVIEECDFQDSPHAIWGRGSGGIGYNGNWHNHNHFALHETAAVVFDAVSGNILSDSEFNGDIETAVLLDNATSVTKIMHNHHDQSTIKVLINSAAATDNYIIAETGAGSITDNGTRTTIIGDGWLRVAGVDISADFVPTFGIAV